MSFARKITRAQIRSDSPPVPYGLSRILLDDVLDVAEASVLARSDAAS